MAAGDAGAFVLNIISSVFIISVNKRLMGSPPNFNFRYVVTLNALHHDVDLDARRQGDWAGQAGGVVEGSRARSS